MRLLIVFVVGMLFGAYLQSVPNGLTESDRAEPQMTSEGPTLTCSDGTQLQCLDSVWSFDPLHTKIKPKPYAMGQMILNTEKAKPDQCREMQNAMDVWKAAGCMP